MNQILKNICRVVSNVTDSGLKSSCHYSAKSLHEVISSMQTDLGSRRKRVQIAADNLRNIRIDKKQGNKKYPPSHIYLQVLGNNQNGTPSCLYLFSNNGRYIFNCGEGTQRASTEFKLKMSVLEHIFLTSSTWKSLGGLPGLSLTLHDMGIPGIKIHAASEINELFHRMSYFVPVGGMKVEGINVEDKEFTDEVFSVIYVPVVADKSRIDMCYICKIHPKKGALLPEKCAELGINPGPIFSNLKNGEVVTLPNGKEVHPNDVCLPDDPGPIFIILESTTEKSVEGLLSSDCFAQYFESGLESSRLKLIVHFTDSSLVSSSNYIRWMKRFPGHVKHLFLNDLCADYGSEAIYRMQYKLNQADEKIFPLLHQKYVDSDMPSYLEEFNATIGKTMMKYSLRPDVQFDNSCIPEILPETYIQEALNVDGFQSSLVNYKKEVANLLDPMYDHLEFPKVIFLGTGSCIPNKARNTSGIFIKLNSNSNILLDVGEGTICQMLRLFGESEMHLMLVNLKSIYISHMHADHHIGLIGVLQARKEAFKELKQTFNPVYLFAPNNIMSWLDYYDSQYENISENYILYSNMNLLNSMDVESCEDSLKVILGNQGLSKIQTCFVHHCPHAYGVSLTTTNGFKLVYSGDCRPDPKLVELGNGCDLLIHEATLEDSLEEEAQIKMHCTTSEALEVSKAMNARYVILTHFSQRYARVPLVKNLENVTNVGIAYDFMMVSPMDYVKLPRLTKLLVTLFAEYYEELEQKTERKVQQKKLKLDTKVS